MFARCYYLKVLEVVSINNIFVLMWEFYIVKDVHEAGLEGLNETDLVVTQCIRGIPSRMR